MEDGDGDEEEEEEEEDEEIIEEEDAEEYDVVEEEEEQEDALYDEEEEGEEEEDSSEETEKKENLLPRDLKAKRELNKPPPITLEEKEGDTQKMKRNRTVASGCIDNSFQLSRNNTGKFY